MSWAPVSGVMKLHQNLQSHLKNKSLFLGPLVVKKNLREWPCVIDTETCDWVCRLPEITALRGVNCPTHLNCVNTMSHFSEEPCQHQSRGLCGRRKIKQFHQADIPWLLGWILTACIRKREPACCCPCFSWRQGHPCYHFLRRKEGHIPWSLPFWEWKEDLSDYIFRGDEYTAI